MNITIDINIKIIAHNIPIIKPTIQRSCELNYFTVSISKNKI